MEMVLNKTKEDYLEELDAFATMPPGIDSRNYEGNTSACSSDRRRAARDLSYFRILLGRVEDEAEITASDIYDTAHYQGGRLRIVSDGWDYIPGQYRPTEYRHAACCFLSSLLWNRWLADKREGKHDMNPRERAKATLPQEIARIFFT